MEKAVYWVDLDADKMHVIEAAIEKLKSGKFY
jgi:hypothetical protein